MMVHDIKENISRIVILDISGVYAQIYDQGYFSNNEVKDIKKRYNDIEHWHVLVIG